MTVRSHFKSLFLLRLRVSVDTWRDFGELRDTPTPAKGSWTHTEGCGSTRLWIPSALERASSSGTKKSRRDYHPALLFIEDIGESS
jgi:hypothetical protein